MLTLLNSARRGQMICHRAGQYRTVVCTPPRVRVSFAEKVAHGIVITLSCWAIPAWVAVNIKHWRPKEE